MSLNTNYLDLTNSVWTPTEFQNHTLTVVDGKITISSEITEAAESGWLGKIMKGAKYWTVGDEPSSINVVSEGINQLALQQLNQEYRQSNAELKAPHSLEERISIIQNTIKHLGNLKQNLTNHNSVVEDYNKSFYTNFLVCPDHTEAIKAVDAVIAKLNLQKATLEKDRTKTAAQEFEKMLSELEINLNNGMVMTKDVLLLSYPRILKQVKIAGLEDQPEMLNKLHNLLNKSYVSYLIEAIKQDQIPLPYSIQTVLSKLGLKEGEMQARILEGKNQLILLLESYFDKNHLTEPSNEFVEKLQNDFIELVANTLTSSHDEKLKPLIRELYLFELGARKIMQQIEQLMRDGVEDVIKIMPTETDEEKREIEILKDLWRLYKFPDFLPDIFNQLTGNKEFDLSLLSTIQQKKNVLNKDFFDLYEGKTTEVLSEFTEEAKKLAHIPTWAEKNLHAQRFSFDQSGWGDQEIFAGEGCCAAINYRWIKHLLQNPSRTVYSADDFLDRNTKTDARSESGVIAQDRIVQATCYLENDPQGGIGSSILKRDKLTCNQLEKMQFSIEALIDSLYKNHYKELITDQGGGIVDIGMAYYDKKQNVYIGWGHAIGMQIEPTRSIFRFWDVNYGFYQYQSLEELREAFKGFIEAHYKNYNAFDAYQYLRN